MKAYVLEGWGIECEQEMKRAAERCGVFTSVERLVLPKILASQDPWPFTKNDWVLLPGGFSYSDHFGSGKLLGLKLQEMKFFDSVYKTGAHVLGVCNGFQTLTESGAFGPTTRLHANIPQGFKNRWIQLSSPLVEESIRLPVRHGEGRLTWENTLPQNVKVILSYSDHQFQNGSRDNIAGLCAKVNESFVWGMMPHPEIALGVLDDPDNFATDYFEQHREKLWLEEGAGMKLLKKIFQGASV